MGNEQDLWAIFDEMVKQEIISMNSMRFIKIIKELLSYFYQFRISGSLVIDPDANGYCQSVIEEICNVADLYRGYKRKGKIFLTKQDRDQKEEK